MHQSLLGKSCRKLVVLVAPPALQLGAEAYAADFVLWSLQTLPLAEPVVWQEERNDINYVHEVSSSNKTYFGLRSTGNIDGGTLLAPGLERDAFSDLPSADVLEPGFIVTFDGRTSTESLPEDEELEEELDEDDEVEDEEADEEELEDDEDDESDSELDSLSASDTSIAANGLVSGVPIFCFATGG